ncbi:hypothetical protein FPRO06_05238 [Fusarium proliferatum]|nr:hypothetical protein FPRO03_08942 [Fusarium proliferatum]KAG4273883.1 hypothetical protein FPRO04_01524 [Fusarium proliferatum]KAG4287586.1 hypothetical protein FPRO06_05238 [Fusarium proliferatum]
MDEEDPLANFAFADVSADEADEAEATKSRRTGQSEEAWRVVQKQYKAKVENGDKVKLPLGPDATKMDIQEVIHAVEEHYFFHRYREAEQLAGEALKDGQGLDRDSRQLLEAYRDRCHEKHEQF